MPDHIKPEPARERFDAAMRACGATDLGNCWEWEGDDFLERLVAHVYVQAQADASTYQAGRQPLPVLNDDLIEILGRPNFACANLAAVLRAGGVDIRNRAEDEQAAVLHFLLLHYLTDPVAWREKASATLHAMTAGLQRTKDDGDG